MQIKTIRLALNTSKFTDVMRIIYLAFRTLKQF